MTTADTRVRLTAMPCAVSLVMALGACTTPPGAPAPQPAASAAHEEIFVLRSRRVERIPQSTWCSLERTGSGPYPNGYQLEDRFAMHTVSTRADDGRVASANAGLAGEFHTCLGPSGETGKYNFYVEGTIAGVAFTGTGPCMGWRADYPEKGFSIGVCMITLKNLPPPYVGGLLVTNSLNSKALLGGDTDPPGYTQTSIAAIRLWK